MTTIILAVIVGILVLDRLFSFRVDKFDYDFLVLGLKNAKNQCNDINNAYNQGHKFVRSEIEECHRRISERGMETTEKIKNLEEKLCIVNEHDGQDHSVILQLLEELGYEAVARDVGECEHHGTTHSEVVIKKIVKSRKK